MNSARAIIDALKKKGCRTSKLRLALLDILEKTTAPLAATDILLTLSQHELHPNKTSVYREIDLLLAHGFIEEVATGDRASAYKLTSPDHHHHLICDSCRRTVDIADEELEQAVHEAEKTLGKAKGFRITAHDISFRGVCQDCQ